MNMNSYLLLLFPHVGQKFNVFEVLTWYAARHAVSSSNKYFHCLSCAQFRTSDILIWQPKQRFRHETNIGTLPSLRINAAPTMP